MSFEEVVHPPQPPKSAASTAPQLVVCLPGVAEPAGESAGHRVALPLTPDRWERLAVPLPRGWDGRGGRLEPVGGFALLEIAGVRVVPAEGGDVWWECLGGDLIQRASVTNGAQAMATRRRLRLLCDAGAEASVGLPDLDLPAVAGDASGVLEIGVRVRTEAIAVWRALQEYVEDANTGAQEALAEAEVARARLVATEQSAEALAATLNQEVTMAREHGDQRAAALSAQVSEQQARAEADQQRIGALEQTVSTLKAQSADTLAQLATLRAEFSRTEAGLAEMTGSRDTERGRVRSMQASVSWRLTLPLRAVARAFKGKA